MGGTKEGHAIAQHAACGAAESYHEEIDYLVHCLNPFDIREVQHVSGYDILRVHRSAKIRLFVGKAAKRIAGYFLHPTQ